MLTAHLQLAAIISWMNPDVLGKLLHFTQAGLKSSKVDSSVVCEEYIWKKNHLHVSYQADNENCKVGTSLSFSPHFSSILSTSIQGCPNSGGTSTTGKGAWCEGFELAVTQIWFESYAFTESRRKQTLAPSSQLLLPQRDLQNCIMAGWAGVAVHQLLPLKWQGACSDHSWRWGHSFL